MKHPLLLAATLALCAPVMAGDLKPGLWQINTTMEGDNLPPQMRAHTQQDCLSADRARTGTLKAATWARWIAAETV